MESALAILDNEKVLTPREQYILENIALVDEFQDELDGECYE